jgi:hypothetical protein
MTLKTTSTASIQISRLTRILPLSGFLVICSFGVLRAAEPTYSHDPSTWHEEVRPPRTNRVARSLWQYAANYSKINWRVSAEGGQVCARLSKGKGQQAGPRPEFDPKAGQFRGPSAFARVEDGWLIGFNHGEFGAALYWFSRDGSRNYKISDHQVVDFVPTPDGTFAVEGLAHLGTSRGSLIRIARANGDERWKANSLAKLPFAPYAVSRRRDGILLITLSDSLVAVTPGDKVQVETLLAGADWGGFYPNSSALTSDGRKLYIGMRQFLGEFDLETKTLRFLIPDNQFLNRLSKEEEEQIRIQEGG